MRDAVAVETQGVPVVLLVTRGVFTLARATATASRLPGLRVLAVESSLVGLSREQVATTAGVLRGDIVAALVAGGSPPSAAGPRSAESG